jgi:hypothetical protein
VATSGMKQLKEEVMVGVVGCGEAYSRKLKIFPF